MSTELKLGAYMAIDERDDCTPGDVSRFSSWGNMKNQPQALKRNPFSVTEWHE
jgi:hypothetical protein